MNRRPTGSRGYSLSELLTIVAMLGVITLVTVPALMQIMPQYRIRGAASETAANIRQIRQRAMTTRTTHRISFDPVNERYSYSMLTAQTADPNLAASWDPLTSDARREAEDTEWITVSSVDLRTNTTNAFNDVVQPNDSKVDLIFLRDGSVSSEPHNGGSSPGDDLTFTPTKPSIVFAVDSSAVKYNRYYLYLSESGTVTITGTKE